MPIQTKFKVLSKAQTIEELEVTKLSIDLMLKEVRKEGTIRKINLVALEHTVVELKRINGQPLS